MDRKLAAILAADVVGYSRLMEQNEADTFERLRAHRKELFEPKITQHNGRVFKLMGDGLLAEFASVVDAVECAVDLQRGMAERNAGLPDAQRIDCRIGVNLGDVIVENEDRHGEGVIIAARLQQLAEPGGIAISGTVADHVKHKLALRLEPRGQESLKNIAEPVAVYRVLLGTVAVPAPRQRKQSRHWLAGSVAAVALSLAIGTGAGLYFRDAIRNWPWPSSGQGVPVIAVLPFQNLTGSQASGNPVDLQEVGKGIAEEFTTALATFPDFEVVSSTSASAYADKPISEIVKATGALFVIEGSIREGDGNLMVTVQLINGQTDRHLRIAQFEEPMTNSVSLQTATANRLRDEMGGMTGVLRSEYNKMAVAKVGADRTEYDYYVLGHIYHLRFDRDDMLCARKIWEEGLARYPDSALLRYKLSFVYSWLGWHGEKDGFQNQAQLVDEAAKLPKKSRLDEWYAHIATAWSEFDRHEMARAVLEAKTSVAMAPYDSLTQAGTAEILDGAGLYDDAIEFTKFATTHDPNPRDFYYDDLIHIYGSAKKWPAAVELAETETRDKLSPDRRWYKVLAAAYAATGQVQKSQDASKKFESLSDPPAEWQPPACDALLQ
jgi:class 3 adenylate cyclase/TolB-like protein